MRHAIFCTYVKEITIYEDRLEVEFVNVHRFKIRWDEVGHKKVCISMEREMRLAIKATSMDGAFS